MLELSELTVDVLIVGAGLAGLTCARQLQAEGVSCLVLEAADAVGGRIRTDQVDGYLLDRGFQVFLSSYPEPKRWLDLERLQLKRFASGARVRYRGRFYDLADPWRRPWTALGSLVSPIGTLTDKLRIARLRSISKRGSYEERMQDPEVTSHEYLKQLGFSRSMIDNFLRPFLGGIFLDRELNTSSRMLNFVFRMFSTGDACLPANGMQSIPEQLASSLWPGTIRLNAPVAEIRPRSVTLQSGEKLMAFRIVVATEAPTAKRLLSMSGETKGRGVRCLYFAAEQAPFTEPILVLNGDGLGPINNLCVPSNVCASYAPPKQSLISVTSMDCTTVNHNWSCKSEISYVIGMVTRSMVGDICERITFRTRCPIRHRQLSRRPIAVSILVMGCSFAAITAITPRSKARWSPVVALACAVAEWQLIQSASRVREHAGSWRSTLVNATDRTRWLTPTARRQS